MNVIVTVATTPPTFPAGTVRGGIIVTLSGIAPVTLAAAPYVATFADVPAGDYSVTAQAVDAAGAALGAPATATVTVPSGEVSIDIPVSLSVQVQ